MYRFIEFFVTDYGSLPNLLSVVGYFSFSCSIKFNNKKNKVVFMFIYILINISSSTACHWKESHGRDPMNMNDYRNCKPLVKQFWLIINIGVFCCLPCVFPNSIVF